jgi:hypothetical protein
MITKFKKFEKSHFHSINQIDEILDKISETGIESLGSSDIAILLNYSEDDELVHSVLTQSVDTVRELKEMSKLLKVLTKNDQKELEKISGKYMELNMRMAAYNDALINIFKIHNYEDIKTYLDKVGLTTNSGSALEDDQRLMISN